MYIEPNTNIKILSNVPLDNTYEHTIYFASKSAQYNYFSSKVAHNLTNNTYQRVNRGKARVNRTAEELYGCNYMMFQNTSFGNRWFYAFITGIEYVNNITSEVTFEIDSLQTYWFDTKFNQCFVDRQHTITDNAGDNTMPEAIDIGPITCSEYHISNLFSHYHAVICKAYSNGDQTASGGYITGLFTGCDYFGGSIETQEGVEALQNYLKAAVDANEQDSIVSVFLMPSSFFTTNSEPVAERDTIAIPTSIHHYIPKNKKLLTFPYNYLSVDCGNNAAIYRYEWFGNRSNIGNNVRFVITGNVSCNPQIMAVPESYNGAEDNDLNWTEKIVMDGFPQVAWSTDSFRAWLAQSASKTALTGVGSVGGIAVGAMTSNPVMIGAGALGLASAINDTVLASNRPPQAHGTDSGGIDVATRTKAFIYKRMQVDLNHAIVIDDFFSVYGYSVCEVKTPNFAARPHWTYIKTRNCSVDSNAPADDVKKICSIIDNGITFWRNANEVGNYSLDNSPA